jgi:hypothetical protein
MKTTFKTLFYLLLFVSLSFSARAQYIPDSLRIGVGIQTVLPIYVNNSYNSGLGFYLHADVPIGRKSYITGSVGYNVLFPAPNTGTNPDAIVNVKQNNLETIPLKIGYKLFIIKMVYVQGEVGETLVANKSQVYATNSTAFTYSPRIGGLIRIKKHSYVDVGVGYEGVSSFYNDNTKYNFWSIHASYAFNL